MRSTWNKNLDIDEYGIKEVPDIFFCDKNGEVLYFSRTLKSVEFEEVKDQDFTAAFGHFNTLWGLKIKDCLGNFSTWFGIQERINDGTITSVYLRTKAKGLNAQDWEDYCLRIEPYKTYDIKGELSSSGEPFKYDIGFTFYIPPRRTISDDAPIYGVDENVKEYVRNAKFPTRDKSISDIKYL